MEYPGPNLLITGIPRAGTTLLTALIDSSAGAVGLSEPDWTWQLKDKAATAEEYADLVLEQLAKLRRYIVGGRPIRDRRGVQGKAVTNYYDQGTNRATIALEQSVVRDVSNSQFLLAVKDNATFLSALPELAKRDVNLVAVIRDPAEVFASWRSVDIPISTGALPAGEKFWPALAGIRHKDVSLAEKHALFFDVICERLWQHRDRVTIIRYGELISKPLKILDKHGVRDANLSLIDQSARQKILASERDSLMALQKHAKFAQFFFSF
jgi:hypothetical protein